MYLSQLTAGLEKLAPLSLAEDWDNTGVLIQPFGSPEVERVLLAIDLTEAVASEAVEISAQVIIAYHPPIFSGLKRLTPQDRAGRVVMKLLHHGIAVYTPHTALDATPGGINDWLCEAFGPGHREPIVPSPYSAELTALFETFAEQTDPGQGRKVVLSQPLTLEDAVYRVKQHLGLKTLRLAASHEHEQGTNIRSVGVCAGAGGSLLVGCAADLYLTGEMRHHDVLNATQTGTSVILTEHTNSERGYLPHLATKMRRQFPKLDVVISSRDKDPLRVV